MNVHVYRNRADDQRHRDDLHFCRSCNGWYGVPHAGSHCQNGGTARWRPSVCACRFCREATGQPIEGSYGFITSSFEWQP